MAGLWNSKIHFEGTLDVEDKYPHMILPAISLWTCSDLSMLDYVCT